MTVLLGVVAALLVLAVLVNAFLRVDAARLAGSIQLAGPVTLGIVGGLLLVLGRAALGSMVLAAALALYGAGRRNAPVQKPKAGRKSTVRTAALEMELDHDTGALEGLVLAGRHESKWLGKMNQAQLFELMADLGGDFESRQLLETYLDGRFPVWRNDAKADDRNRQGVAPGAGAMTKEEAYKVLGLETGATATDVRQAHRRLIQRLHPDVGGTSFLAARINEAKDVLLSNHS